jgi:hypothetical protein
MADKYVLLLGAGASVADVATRSLRSRPPLDSGFFRLSRSADPTDPKTATVRQYFDSNYGIDIVDPALDSLEGVMSRLYPDLYNELLKTQALIAFRSLVQLFTSRLAVTTNDIRATQKRLLYRMLSRLLGSGIDPKDITIITFNQDLQVEKILEHLCEADRWASLAGRLFSFPGLYAIPESDWEDITGPGGPTPAADLFPQTSAQPDYLEVLKLHGSLNWYSTHNSARPSRRAMFNPRRRLSVTRRKTIAPDMTLNRPSKRVYTLPVVVPPVNHKSDVLHESLATIWTRAERRLAKADHVVVFGYSCPALDFESANLITRAHRKRPDGSTLTLIDPDGAVVTRYIDLLSPSRLSYFASAHDFLGA